MLSFLGGAQNRKKKLSAINHRLHREGKGEKAADQRKASPFSTPPLPDKKKKSLGKRKSKNLNLPYRCSDFRERKLFSFPPFRRISGSTTKKHIFRTEFPGWRAKKAVSASFPRPIRQSQSVDPAGNVKKDNIHSGTHIGFSHKK